MYRKHINFWQLFTQEPDVLLMGTLRATPLYIGYCKENMVYFDDILPVKVFTYILYSRATQLFSTKFQLHKFSISRGPVKFLT